jgi:hypothetical protein
MARAKTKTFPPPKPQFGGRRTKGFMKNGTRNGTQSVATIHLQLPKRTYKRLVRLAMIRKLSSIPNATVAGVARDLIHGGLGRKTA